MKTMVVLRGIPGSGKSTYQRAHFPDAVVVSADHFFMVGEEYRFNPALLSEAHGSCFQRAIAAVQDGTPLVVVDNTNTSAMEASPYVLLGQAYGYDVQVITLLVDADAAAARNVHGVPATAVLAMDKRLRGEFIPPWWQHQVVE